MLSARWPFPACTAVVRRCVLPVSFSCGVLVTLSLHAQSFRFLGSQTLLSNAFSTPKDTAVDANGNVYVVDAANDRVVKIAPGASADCATGCTTVATGFSAAAGIGLDAAGNTYVTDTLAGTLVQISPAGAKSTVATLAQPGGLAVDASGNSYVTLAGGSAVKVTPAGVVTTVATGLSHPVGVAVDASGNLFVADTGNNQIVEIVSGGAQSAVVTGLNAPQGVAVDTGGMLYIGDTGNNRVLEVPVDVSSVDCTAGCTALGSALTAPLGLSADANGNVYLVNGTTQAARIAASVDMGSIAVAAPTPASQTLNYALPGSDCSAASAVNVLTRGAAGKDFTLAGPGTCTPGAPTTYSIVVTFNPRFAGLRSGAVQLTDTSGNVLATTYLQGTGIGPQLTWTPAVLSQATP